MSKDRISQKKSLIMSEIMTPNMTNFTGNVHGGYLLSLLDKVAYACACRYSGLQVVTLSVDRVVFKEPLHVGDLVTCYANVNFVGKTSMEVGIKVMAEDLRTGHERHTNTCYFTMVAVDKHHKPASIPPLTLDNDVDKRRFTEAQYRRELRLTYQEKHRKLKDSH